MWKYIQSYSDELCHYGILGMKWGVRKDRGSSTGASSKTVREVSKDVKEYARAKMFYGEGAGTRRKLIKAKVEAKAKKDPIYKAEFDKQMAEQDMGEHATKAHVERKAKDVKNTTVKTTRGIYNIATGNAARASAGLVAAYSVAKFTGLDKKAIQFGKNVVNDILWKMNKGPI